MKIYRIIALAAIAMLMVGALGLFSYRTFAQSSQSATTQDCGADVDDANEAQDVEDTDDIQLECGSQDENVDEAGDVDEADDVDEAGDVDEADTGDVNDANEGGETQGADEAAPARTPVTADGAQAIVEAANPGTTTLNVEFDRENGTDIWEVELDNGMDVKVDAGSGVILLSEERD